MRALNLIVLAVAIAGLSACATPTQLSLDSKLRDLCAKDGGLKVHETVGLPADAIDSKGWPRFAKGGLKPDTLGADYVFEFKTDYIVKGDDYRVRPSLTRTYMAVIRKHDGKILGEVVEYVRIGGGLESAFQGGGTSCSHGISIDELVKRVFVERTS